MNTISFYFWIVRIIGVKAASKQNPNARYPTITAVDSATDVDALLIHTWHWSRACCGLRLNRLPNRKPTGILPMHPVLLVHTLAAVPLLSRAIEEPGQEVSRTFDKLAKPVLARYSAPFAPGFMQRNATGLAVR